MSEADRLQQAQKSEEGYDRPPSQVIRILRARADESSKLRQRLYRAEEALRWYGDKANYDKREYWTANRDEAPSLAEEDAGQKARDYFEGKNP